MAGYWRVDHFCRSKWRKLYRISKAPARTCTSGGSGGSQLRPFDAVCWTLMLTVNPTRSNGVLHAVATGAFSSTYTLHMGCVRMFAGWRMDALRRLLALSAASVCALAAVSALCGLSGWLSVCGVRSAPVQWEMGVIREVVLGPSSLPFPVTLNCSAVDK